MNLRMLSGAGNRFAVLDVWDAAPPADPARLAQRLCAELEPRPDGLLLLQRGTRGGDCAMVLYNSDGSRPETCGNGLRCIAKLAFEAGYVGGERFTIEDDAGLHATQVVVENGAVTRAKIHMGTPRILARDAALEVDGQEYRATLVDVGNPHCVLFVDDEQSAPVRTLGPRLERHARFERGTNVEFLAIHGGRGRLRVWERGVGETQACGSGACAAAWSAVAAGLCDFPLELALPGGTLVVDRAEDGGVTLLGPVEELAFRAEPALPRARVQ
jgi:diaminopimelate epimerase